MSPTSGMHHSRPADLVISHVSIGLENAFELSQEPLRSIPSTAHSEIKDHGSSGATVLPKIRLVILSPALARLYIDWGFVRLNVASANQLSPHRGDHGDEQLADFENPPVQGCSADFQADVSLQNHALTMQWRVIAIFADDRVDDDPVTGQALLNDPWWQWC